MAPSDVAVSRVAAFLVLRSVRAVVGTFFRATFFVALRFVVFLAISTSWFLVRLVRTS